MTWLDQSDLFAKFHGNAPAGRSELERFEAESGIELPRDYVEFLGRSDGGEGFIGNAYAILWRLGDLTKMNDAYQVEEYAPGFFIFGSDGGGEAFAFDARTSAKPIVSLPFVGMEPKLARSIAPTFRAFLAEIAKS